ncbi:MAG: response regulator [Candidatus Melainabacteria bacterium]|nr:response regulator [Candidatus Melainabacteria bacterium]
MNDPNSRPTPLMEMADLARAFSLTLVDSIKEIEEVLEQRSNPEEHLELLAKAIHISHKIRGCAGTLGLDTTSRAFGALEDQLNLISVHGLERTPEAMTALLSTITLCKTLVRIEQNESLITGETPVFRIAPIMTAGARMEDIEKLVDESGQLIMLIEDDSFYIGIVQAVLSSDTNFNNGLLSARSLEEAAQLLADCEPDIILLDLSLPDSDGLESFHRIQKLAPDVPILILTAVDNTPLADELVACGAQTT